ncbi:hypothetical protein [Pontibacter actiniarum]|uniref:hypothetical protein n=1 Tax=Pontibacter actiniarum TaxID=323450 RepID=UPI0012F8CCD0|nr:hypothetical protein [Pontibacter actiniarum]
MAKKRLLIILSLALTSATVISCKPTCPIASCHVRMVHPHGTQEFRGQPFWKKQNPKMGEKMDKTSQEKTHEGHSKAKNKD